MGGAESLWRHLRDARHQWRAGQPDAGLEPAILAGELMTRDPALIVLAYGTNEALSRAWTAEEYRGAFTEIIHRLRAAAPVASILLVGPPDCEHPLRGHRLPFPHLDEVIEIQRASGARQRLRFLGLARRMGGPGSVRQWVQAGLGQGDYVHFTGDQTALSGGARKARVHRRRTGGGSTRVTFPPASENAAGELGHEFAGRRKAERFSCGHPK